LTKLWSIKLFATAIATPPELNFGRGVFHSDLQTLHYHQDDMHTQYLTNEEDIEFQKVISAKQMPGKSMKAKHREIGITATISPGLELGRGVFRCVLQPLCYNSADIHKLTSNIHEVMAFPKWLSVKRTAKSGLKSVLYSHIWTLGKNTYLAPKFM
jgi:hypothetical protein